MKKILIIGDITDKHNERFIKQLNKSNKLIIYIFSYTNIKNDYTNKLFFVNKRFPNIFYKIPKIKGFLNIIDTTICLKRISNNQKFDIININALSKHFIFSYKILRKMCNVLIITPLGSDVYRISKFQKWIYSKIYNYADFIVAAPLSFQTDVKEIFKVKNNKLVNLDFGSDIIDSIIENKITKYDAKKYFNIENNYVISCGYNASPAQNHKIIIQEIVKIKDKLPNNYILLFQMTYPNNNEYKRGVEDMLRKYDINYIMFSNYLQDIDIVKIRKATDLFIHIQNTDAYAGSIQEYLLSGSKVINAAWINYPDLEKHGYPYYIVNKFEELSDVIVYSINDNSKLMTEQHNLVINKKSWNYQGQKWINFLSEI